MCKPMYLHHATRLGLVALGLALLAASPAAGKTITVTNKDDEAITFTDLYGGTKAGDRSHTVLKRGDNSDDRNIAPGAKLHFNVPDNLEWFTFSWENRNGLEVESERNFPFIYIGDKMLAGMFDATSPSYALLFDKDQAVFPPKGSEWLVIDGHITGDGDAYAGITFFDTSASDGWIEYDESGNPISPLLATDVVVAGFEYEVEIVPEPASLALLGLGSLFMLRRRRVGT